MASFTYGTVEAVEGGVPTIVILRGEFRLEAGFSALAADYAPGVQVGVFLPTCPEDLVQEPLILGPLIGATDP